VGTAMPAIIGDLNGFDAANIRGPIEGADMRIVPERA
jgi:hypothetical protein